MLFRENMIRADILIITINNVKKREFVLSKTLVLKLLISPFKHSRYFPPPTGVTMRVCALLCCCLLLLSEAVADSHRDGLTMIRSEPLPVLPPFNLTRTSIIDPNDLCDCKPDLPEWYQTLRLTASVSQSLSCKINTTSVRFNALFFLLPLPAVICSSQQTRASTLPGTLAEGSARWGGSAEELRGETGTRPQ